MLVFELENGDTADYLKKMAARMGGDLSVQLERPGVEHGLEMFWQAFWNLDTERRNTDNMIGRIPWSAVVQYATFYEFDRRQTETLIHVIRQMDTVYIKHFLKRMEGKKKS